MIRLFVAIWPTDDVVASIADINLPFGCRRVPAENLHVTLAFLGEVDGRDVDTISAALGTIESPAAELAIDPDPVWFHGGQLVLSVDGADTLSAAIDDALDQRRAHPFRGHITVARTRSSARPTVGAVDVPGGFSAVTFALVESKLNPDGPKYRTLQQFDLG